MTERHTPGPWRVTFSRTSEQTVIGPDVDANGGYTIGRFYGPAAKANADLCAAAPYLLAALVALTGAIHPQADNSPFIHGLLESADAAIAKGRGQ